MYPCPLKPSEEKREFCDRFPSDVMAWVKALESLLPVFRRLGISGTSEKISGTSVAPGEDGCIMTRPHSLSYMLMMTTTTWTTRMINVALMMYQSLVMDDGWCEYADDGWWMMCDLNISIIFLSFLTHGLIFPCCPALVHCCTLSLCHLGSERSSSSGLLTSPAPDPISRYSWKC